MERRMRGVSIRVSPRFRGARGSVYVMTWLRGDVIVTVSGQRAGAVRRFAAAVIEADREA
ncbi:MAG TPA: hypothetical protein VF097_05330 [Actinomycetota bacterium]